MSILKGLAARHMPVLFAVLIMLVCGTAAVLTVKAGALAVASFFAALLVLAWAYLFGLALTAVRPVLKTLRSLR